MADFAGVKMTTESLRSVTDDIKIISGDLDEIMKSFNTTMTSVSGQAEGGIVEKITDTGKDLYDGVMTLSGCFLKLGINIGEYLKMMLTHDSDMADTLRDRIMGN